MRLRRLPAALLIAAALSAVALRSSQPTRAADETAARRVNVYTFFDPIIDIERILADRYVTEVDLAKLRDGAISGMLEALGDPYTEYVPSEGVREFDKRIRGHYVGIGATVRQHDSGGVLIVSPLEDSPALHAGIEAGDRIVAVDGQPVLDKNVDQVIELLTGEPGTDVTLSLERADQKLEKKLTRERIQQRTVAGFRRSGAEGWDFMLDPERRIGYVRVSQFTSSTPAEFEAAVRELIEAGAQGLIIDVRFNPGGLLSAATQMADLFLTDGPIVTTRGRAHQEETVTAVAEGTIPDIPLVVLVNRESASASEVLAGALRDNDRAVILGTRSFGKGSVQTVLPLPSGVGQLKVTEQRYFGPSGKMIHRSDGSTEWGVDPTPGFFVPMADDEYREMLRVRRDRSIIQKVAGAPPTTDSRTILTELKDRQLESAALALASRLQSGQWQPLSDTKEESAVELEELRRAQLARQRLLRELQRAEERITALSAMVPAKDAEKPRLIPESADLTGGRVDIYDAKGNKVSSLSITGGGLENWLTDAPVKREDAAEKKE